MFKPAVLGALFITAGLLSSCASSQSDRKNLQSAAITLTSIAAEGELFAQFVAEGHATAAYAAAHPDYLEQLADSAAKDILAVHAEDAVPNPRDQLLHLAQELQAAIGTLRAAMGDVRSLIQLRQRFADIAQSAKEVGRKL